jgi:phage recombination protein Bet
MSDTQALALTSSTSSVPTVAGAYTSEQMDIIRRQIAKGCSDLEVAYFLHVARARGLDPFSRQIYAIQRGGQMTIMVGIDGLRALAARGGRYRGALPTEWCGADGVWVDVWLQRTPPAAARVSVWHADCDRPIVETATMQSYGQKSGLWSSMPDVMLAKCAEARALRRAFPAECSGLYEPSEIPPEHHVHPHRPQPAPVVIEGRSLPAGPAGSVAQKVVERFSAIGVDAAELELYLQHALDTISDEERVDLLRIYGVCKADPSAWGAILTERFEMLEQQYQSLEREAMAE